MDSQENKHRDWNRLEPRIQKAWQESLAKKTAPSKNSNPFTIMMPPPNVTGTLHAGHALNMTLQDILIRWNRLLGQDCFWIPGTDHAGIATQNVMERKLRARGQSRTELGREAFETEIHKLKGEHQRIIRDQLKALGTSADWSREQFTMNEAFQEATREAFCQLFERGKIYRGQYLVNWCCRCQTALSKEESPKAERRAKFYYIRYLLADEEGSITIATTRPETLLGDTAIAVNPKDTRYQSLIGKQALLPILGRRIPIIGDRHAQFGENQIGTGALKVTPAHDPHDFEIAKRHGLPMISLLTESGQMNENAGEFAGLPFWEAREKIVTRLSELGQLEDLEDLEHAVPECYRCHSDIEPRLSTQWFVSMDEMAKKALEVHRAGDLEWQPSFYGKIFEHWLENIQDWCISRSLWWGHRIPAYYCQDCDGEHCNENREGELRFSESAQPIVARDKPERCPRCGSEQLTQDPDVLDTWFSSWLWPFAAFGWPHETEDLQSFYPTQTLITGMDILFFWVSRMIMAGLEFRGQLPFKTAFIHGMVTDEQGEILTKSKGNGIDPRAIIRSDSADALRFALILSGSEGGESKLSKDHIRQGRSFATKIWNAARLILSQGDIPGMKPGSWTELEDRWMADSLQKQHRKLTSLFEKNKLHEALQSLYASFRGDFCDWYLESLKARWRGPGKSQASASAALFFRHYLQLLHPFLPFITEDLWGRFKSGSGLLMNSRLEEPGKSWQFPSESDDFELIRGLSRGLRDLRRRQGWGKSRTITLYLSPDSDRESLLRRSGDLLQLLAGKLELRFESKQGEDGFCPLLFGTNTAWIESGGVEDRERARRRIESALQKLQKGLLKLDAQLANKGFLGKAPQAVIERSRATRRAWRDEARVLEKELEDL